VKYAFIRQHREQYSLQSLNKVLHVSRSGYYDWLHRAPSARVQANNVLLGHIRAAHIKHRHAYGALKTWRYLNSVGIACGKHRVARLRKQAGIEAQRKRRFRLTVEYHHTPKAAPDLLQRQFSSDAPNRA
jgi:putative transposase